MPRVRDVLGVPLQVALLKGRANYLCTHRLENSWLDGRHRSRELTTCCSACAAGRRARERGDVAELVDIPEDAPVWPLVTSTTDNCLASSAPAIRLCHLVEARRRAQEADVVIVNHHLLCADFALRDDGFGELLPSADCYVWTRRISSPRRRPTSSGTASARASCSTSRATPSWSSAAKPGTCRQ